MPDNNMVSKRKPIASPYSIDSRDKDNGPKDQKGTPSFLNKDQVIQLNAMIVMISGRTRRTFLIDFEYQASNITPKRIGNCCQGDTNATVMIRRRINPMIFVVGCNLWSVVYCGK